MTTFYSRLADSAYALIQAKGKALTVQRTSGGTYDPVTSAFTVAETVTSNTVYGVITPLTRIDDNRYLQDLVEGKMRKITIAAKDTTIEPRAGDRIVDGASTIEVIGATPVDPAGTPLIYKVQGRVIA